MHKYSVPGTQNPELRQAIFNFFANYHRNSCPLPVANEGFESGTVYEIKKDSHKDYPSLFGAPPGTRTLDPLIKSQLLYQLS